MDRLPVQNWMQDQQVGALFNALIRAGAVPRFVGGCVRDALLGRQVGDIDVAVDIEPLAVMDALASSDIRTVPTGIAFGTVTALLAERTVEITSLRRDVETDGRRAVVAYTTDWHADSERRDFTMNALYCDREGKIWDFHDGQADLEARRIRFVGDPDQRIREDVLRILRFFRFHAQLGFPHIDPQGLAACTRQRALLPLLSAERVTKELFKLLQADDPVPVLEAMDHVGILDPWLPEARDRDSLARLIQRFDSRDAILRLAALCPISPDQASALAARLKLSNHDRSRLMAMNDPIPAPTDAKTARRYLHAIGLSAGTDRARIGLARDGEDWSILLTQSAHWQPPVFPLTGADAIEAGIAPGPDLGARLRRAEAVWIDSDFTADRATLLAALKGEGE